MIGYTLRTARKYVDNTDGEIYTDEDECLANLTHAPGYDKETVS
jgi:hypothetical protein